ncbi:MAG: glyoxalase [Crocinitomicaceae bacterium]
MDKRITLRPVVESAKVDETTHPNEVFQNETLRPIIKMQHLLILAFVSDHVLKLNKEFPELSKGKQRAFATNLFAKDSTFKHRLAGLILGQFTVEEFKLYTTIAPDVNKRILNICLERMMVHLNEIGTDNSTEDQ